MRDLFPALCLQDGALDFSIDPALFSTDGTENPERKIRADVTCITARVRCILVLGTSAPDP